MASEDLRERATSVRDLMAPCRLCPRDCQVDRIAGELGFCRTGASPIVSSFGPHFGEEAPLVGRHGSGTIFLTNCNLRCLFCQNCDVSQLGQGTAVTVERLAGMMLELQRQGCHNINWVTPTHQTAALVEALAIARDGGLTVPIVYNCGGYESVETLRLLEGIVDIYMPDAKYGDNATGERLSSVADYWDRCRHALAEMYRQVGDLQIDSRGVATRGLLVRHLVLPEDLAGTLIVMKYIAGLSANTYVNVMAQYRPQFHAHEVSELRRAVTVAEYEQAVQAAREAGLHRLDDRRIAK
ncbi:MAG: radical SAM protein [Candidatus Eisenbacteria bacterium]|nr:radical SAM protein [Candidatus Eisenbacteria bacterium]